MTDSSNKNLMGLKQLLADPTKSALAINRFAQPTPPVMVQTAKSICETLLGVEPKEPTSRDLQEVYKRVLKLYKENKNLLLISRRDLRLVPWLLFVGGNDLQPPLADNIELFRSYLVVLKSQQDSRSIMTLAHVVLWQYPHKEMYFKSLLQHLNDLINELTTLAGIRLQQKKSEFDLFLLTGPDKISQALIRSGNNPEMVLGEVGLKGACLTEGIIKVAFSKWLQRIFVGLTQYPFQQIKKQIENVLNFSIIDGAFRFPQQKINLPESLLLPFAQKKAANECKELLTLFFVEHFGDPRIDEAGWIGVSSEAQQVLRSWLVEDTMEDFFRLLDYVADNHPESEIDKMWKYRKAFWAAYLKNGLIEDAWVALGSAVVPDAHRFIGPKKNQYASLYGAQSSHSILIMRIQDLVIVEWSHSGKCRFWHDSNKSNPELYRRYYDRSDVVVDAEEEISHHGADNYLWQSKAANYIRRQTGVSVRLREYTV